VVEVLLKLSNLPWLVLVGYRMTNEGTKPQTKHADRMILPSKNTYKCTLE